MNGRLVDAIRAAPTHRWIAGLLLLGCYGALSLLLDPGGYLGTDTGTKVYTLEVMDREGTWSPDIGYWAGEQDPGGGLHPVYQARARPDGSWVGVTTLPMLELARPLYAVGGYRMTLLLPMLGGVAAAYAARRIGRALEPAADGWLPFWVIGLGSPTLLYSLDFWEHSVGLACMLWAVAVLLGVAAGRPQWWAAGAGVLFGAAAVLRQEALIYTLVAVGAVCLVLLVERRSVVPPAVTGAAAVAGFAVPWLLNAWLEESVQGQSRASRSSGTAAAAATGATADTLADRAREGLQTLMGLVSGDAALSALLGAAVIGAVVVASRAERRGDRTFAGIALGAAAAVYLADAVGGLGFVPGLLTAFPLAIGGFLVWRSDRRTTVVVGVAVVALPLVYAFQYLGGAPPQWGGRYTLASGALLGIAGVVRLRERAPLVRRGLIALSLGVTALGYGWLVERTHAADQFFEDLVAEAEPVVIARQAFLLREGGAAIVDRRWLSVGNEDQFQRAVDVAREVGERRFTVLEWEGEAPPDAALPDDIREVSRTRMAFVNTPVGVVTYEFVG